MARETRAAPVRGVLLFLLGTLVGANLTYFVMSRGAAPPADRSADVVVGAAALPANRSTQLPSAAAGSQPLPAADPVLPPPVASMHGTVAGTAQIPANAPVSSAGLLIPVQGIVAAQLSDTFKDSRSAGRVHDAIDIMAPAGTPVLATADGHVEKLFTSKLGGLTIYEFNRDGTLAYYYAHLQRYADGLAEQQVVSRGQVLGYVGSTGNANPDAPHLHFAIFALGPEKQWWKGEAINPYPLLTAGTSLPNN